MRTLQSFRELCDRVAAQSTPHPVDITRMQNYRSTRNLRYFARDMNYDLCAYADKPIFVGSVYCRKDVNAVSYSISPYSFAFIKPGQCYDIAEQSFVDDGQEQHIPSVDEPAIRFFND